MENLNDKNNGSETMYRYVLTYQYDDNGNVINGLTTIKLVPIR